MERKRKHLFLWTLLLLFYYWCMVWCVFLLEMIEIDMFNNGNRVQQVRLQIYTVYIYSSMVKYCILFVWNHMWANTSRMITLEVSGIGLHHLLKMDFCPFSCAIYCTYHKTDHFNCRKCAACQAFTFCMLINLSYLNTMKQKTKAADLYKVRTMLKLSNNRS